MTINTSIHDYTDIKTADIEYIKKVFVESEYDDNITDVPELIDHVLSKLSDRNINIKDPDVIKTMIWVAYKTGSIGSIFPK